MASNGKRPFVRAIAIGIATVIEHYVGELIDLNNGWAKSRNNKRLDQR